MRFNLDRNSQSEHTPDCSVWDKKKDNVSVRTDSYF